MDFFTIFVSHRNIKRSFHESQIDILQEPIDDFASKLITYGKESKEKDHFWCQIIKWPLQNISFATHVMNAWCFESETKIVEKIHCILTETYHDEPCWFHTNPCPRHANWKWLSTCQSKGKASWRLEWQYQCLLRHASELNPTEKSQKKLVKLMCLDRKSDWILTLPMFHTFKSGSERLSATSQP